MTNMNKLRIEIKGYRHGKTHANTDYLKQSVNIYHDTDSVLDMKLKRR